MTRARRETPVNRRARFALADYRLGVPADSAHDDELAGRAILVASLLDAAAAGGTAGRRALRSARAIAGIDTRSRRCAYDPPGRRSPVHRFRRIAEDAEEVGQLRLADNILESCLTLQPHDVLESGRITFQRARVAYKQGETDLAMAMYLQLERTAKREGLPELTIRAWLGQAATSQVRGNYAAMAGLARKSLRTARREGLDRLEAASYSVLAVHAGATGRISEAIALGWEAYRRSRSDSRSELEFLANVAHILGIAGQWAAARAAAAAVLAEGPGARLALPALGTFARASAALRREDDLAWASKHILAVARRRAHVVHTAIALLECSWSWEALGRPHRAEPLRRRAIALARRHALHEVMYRAEHETPVMPATAKLSGAARNIVGSVAAWTSARPASMDLAGRR